MLFRSVEFTYPFSPVDISSMFLSICPKIVFTFLLIIFDHSIIINGNSIGKACGTGSSSCGLNQACVSGKCECDPKNKFFWTGPTLGCRICPASYHRDRKFQFCSVIKKSKPFLCC